MHKVFGSCDFIIKKNWLRFVFISPTRVFAVGVHCWAQRFRIDLTPQN